MSQSAVSTAVAQPGEGASASRLLLRHHARGLTLTAAGEEFHRELRSYLVHTTEPGRGRPVRGPGARRRPRRRLLHDARPLRVAASARRLRGRPPRHPGLRRGGRARRAQARPALGTLRAWRSCTATTSTTTSTTCGWASPRPTCSSAGDTGSRAARRSR
ncbi:hypothetical protein [Nocardioides convexus]|uniref:hypothetical protein n=1 Tax=Nocardioides convexus TaxID=2712224 RepID=UPI0024182541|nr:hypothetical protein [Nocardioides convexus]